MLDFVALAVLAAAVAVAYRGQRTAFVFMVAMVTVPPAVGFIPGVMEDGAIYLEHLVTCLLLFVLAGIGVVIGAVLRLSADRIRAGNSTR